MICSEPNIAQPINTPHTNDKNKKKKKKEEEKEKEKRISQVNQTISRKGEFVSSGEIKRPVSGCTTIVSASSSKVRSPFKK